MKLFMVGGKVRDDLLGHKTNDIDFTIVLEPNERTHVEVTGDDPFQVMVAGLIGMQFDIKTFEPEHLTVRALFPKGHPTFKGGADFVLARKEEGYSDGRHPDKVTPGTLEDDLARRDFTFNAMAKGEDGEIIDLFNGRTDLYLGLIKTVSDPWKSFGDDHLRMMRALRFAVTKGFKIGDSETLYIKRHIDDLENVSADRIRSELVKMFNADPKRTIDILTEFKAFGPIFAKGINFEPTQKQKVK